MTISPSQPHFGSIICISPALYERSKLAKEKHGAKAEYQVLAGAGHDIIRNNDLKNALSSDSNFITTEDNLITMFDGKQVARTIILNDVRGEHQSHFNGWLWLEHNLSLSRKNKNKVLPTLSDFLGQVSSLHPFNEHIDCGVYYLDKKA